jgi:dihydrolipoamide dehydrogenase
MAAQTLQADAVVVGGGTGGYPTAIRLGQLGKKAILVEAGELGGVCLNVGCIPSKAIIHAADLYAKAAHSAEIGIEVGDARVNWPKMQSWKQGVVKKLTGGVGMLLKGNKVQVVRGRATLRKRGEVHVETAEGPVTIAAPAIVLATGSRPTELKAFPFDGKTVISSTEALSLAEIPKRLLVIGGGYIGLELGIAYRKLGSEVTVLEMMDQLLPGFDLELVNVLARKVKRLAIAVHLKTAAKSMELIDEGARVLADIGGKEQSFVADKVLVTVGRRPNSENLGLAELGVKVDGKGFIEVDAHRQTNVPGIYAVGDVAGEPMLAHKASKEGEVVAEVIAGHRAAFDVRAIPAVVFTDPQIATVGLSEAAAKAQGREVVSAKYPFAALGRALANAETEGFAKVISDKESGLLLGVQVIGYEIADLIAEAALALEMGADVGDLALTVHAHPTLAESLMEAAKLAIGEPIHVLPR